jgi:hypothetical protein
MRDPGPRAGVRGHLRLLAVVVAAVALLAGCDLATGTVRTATELGDAGIRNPNLQYDNGVARVEFDPAPGSVEGLREQERAAEVVWRNLPFRVDRITVASRDQDSLFAQRTYPRAELEARFGPRPAGLDQSPGDIARRVLLWAGIAGLLLLLIVVLIIVLVVRAVRRRPPPQPAGAWRQQPPAQPWGQPQWGQPQWPQPAQQRPGAGEAPPPPRRPGPARPPEGEAPSEERDQGPVPPP